MIPSVSHTWSEYRLSWHKTYRPGARSGKRVVGILPLCEVPWKLLPCLKHLEKHKIWLFTERCELARVRSFNQWTKFQFYKLLCKMCIWLFLQRIWFCYYEEKLDKKVNECSSKPRSKLRAFLSFSLKVFDITLSC